jgi:lipopolysaccharide transport system permease protein
MSRLIIEAGRTEKAYWSDLWRYRELFYFLSWRDILVRYKQTVIGILWAVLRPLALMIIFTVIFGKAAAMPSDGLPYPVWVMAGLLPWQFFATALSEASNSLVVNSNLLSKVYFPRLIVPASSVIVSMIDFLISAVLMIFVMAWYHVVPDARILWAPAFVLIAFTAALGASLWLAALNVKYRDFRYVIPFIVQFGFFASGVVVSSHLVRERFGDRVFRLFTLNPMVGVIDGFRWSISAGAGPQLDAHAVLHSVIVSAILLFIGIRYFRATEKRFADII